MADADKDTALESKSLGCLYGKKGADGEFREPHPLRKACLWLCEQGWYGNLILLLIMVNCIILAMQTPTSGPAVVCKLPTETGGVLEAFDQYKHNCADPADPTKLKHTACDACQIDGLCSCNGSLMPGFDMAHFGSVTEMFFTIAFTFEAVARIIALGFCMHKGSYLRNGWNWLDWVVVVMSWASFIPGVGNYSAIRTVRVFRPLRTMSRIPGMAVIVGALMRSMVPLGSVVMLCTAIFFLFGILASQVWTEMPKTHCGGYMEYTDVSPWLDLPAEEAYICHSLDTYLPIEESVGSGTYTRCGCDQLDGGCEAQLTPSSTNAVATCLGFQGEKQRKMHWFLGPTNLETATNEPVGITEFDASYSALPQSIGKTLPDFMIAYPKEIVDRTEDEKSDITDAMFEYQSNSATGCGCGQVCTTHLEFYCDSMGSVSFDHIG